MPLTWIGMLYGRVKASLAATGGVHGAQDVIKLFMVGANATMMCSSLMRNGINHFETWNKNCETGWKSTNTNL